MKGNWVRQTSSKSKALEINLKTLVSGRMLYMICLRMFYMLTDVENTCALRC